MKGKGIITHHHSRRMHTLEGSVAPGSISQMQGVGMYPGHTPVVLIKVKAPHMLAAVLPSQRQGLQLAPHHPSRGTPRLLRQRAEFPRVINALQGVDLESPIPVMGHWDPGVEAVASRGYGFVTMETKEQAEAAILDPNPIIDGRKANVNLAYLGVKSRNLAPNSKRIYFNFLFKLFVFNLI